MLYVFPALCHSSPVTDVPSARHIRTHWVLVTVLPLESLQVSSLWRPDCVLLLFELVVPSVTFGVMAEEILGNDFPLYDTQDADATEQAAKTSIQIITNASVFFITIFLSVVSDLAIANERGLRYTDIVLVERSSPMRWLLSGIVLQGLSLLLAEAKTKLCPMESPLSSIPFHYIKSTRIKKVAVTIILS